MFDRSLLGPIGTIVQASTLQEYGVDKLFVLDNDNVDATQRNVVFIARGEGGKHAEKIAGQSAAHIHILMFPVALEILGYPLAVTQPWLRTISLTMSGRLTVDT